MKTNKHSKEPRRGADPGGRNKVPHLTNYRVEVTDFGPIIRASVEFRPLTVLVGPSNTGKSYLAALVYAMHQWLTRLVDVGIRSDMLSNLRAWLPSSDGFPKVAPVAFAEKLRLTLQRAPGTRAALVDEIRRCLGIDDLKALNRRSASKVGGVVRFSGPLESEYQIGYEFAFKSGEIALSGPGFNLGIAPFSANLSTLRAGNTASRRDLELRYAAARAVADHLRRGAGAAGRPAHYLPADRAGVMHSRQVVVGALLQSATTAGRRPSANAPLLSGVLADFLNELIAFGGTDPLRQRKTRTEIAEPFERNLLDGSVLLQRNEANYPSFTYRPAGWEEELPLMRASSMVSELAPVVLYLRHVIDAGDVLIIEEPEAHLHPAMQTTLARELARLVRSGVRIVLTTHSEWLLEQIGNLVAVSELPEEHRAGIAGADVALAPDEVGAWFFKPVKRPRGSVVEEVNFGSETGTFETDYDEVSRALYNEGATIFNRRQALQERPSG